MNVDPVMESLRLHLLEEQEQEEGVLYIMEEIEADLEDMDLLDLLDELDLAQSSYLLKLIRDNLPEDVKQEICEAILDARLRGYG